MKCGLHGLNNSNHQAILQYVNVYALMIIIFKPLVPFQHLYNFIDFYTMFSESKRRAELKHDTKIIFG